MKVVGFFARHFLERGTEIATYDYASYNEQYLGNKSIIICFSKSKRTLLGWPIEDVTYDKFKSRFDIIELDDIKDITFHIKSLNISVFHTLVYGTKADEYEFSNKDIWLNCKTIKHCVFDTTFPEGDYYCAISPYLNYKYNTSINVFPHFVDLPNTNESMRNILNIPEDAMVFGGYGGKGSFNIKYVQEMVYKMAKNNTNIFFLFANFDKFCDPLPNIIHLPTIIDPLKKVEFINTCDAMLWGRSDGETFGLSIAEFSIKNKPVICSPIGDTAHIMLLGDKAIIYTDSTTLEYILNKITKDFIKSRYWNAYEQFTPVNIMNIFKNIIHSL